MNDRNVLIHNERIKLWCAFLSRLGLVFLLISGIPVIVIGATVATICFLVFCVIIAILLHIAAYFDLGRMI